MKRNEEVIIKGIKKLSNNTKVVMELLSTHRVSWYMTSDSVLNTPTRANVEYDYSQLDENLEPRAYFKTSTSIMYLDEFDLK
jgi:hypothetical protein